MGEYRYIAFKLLLNLLAYYCHRLHSQGYLGAHLYCRMNCESGYLELTLVNGFAATLNGIRLLVSSYIKTDISCLVVLFVNISDFFI